MPRITKQSYTAEEEDFLRSVGFKIQYLRKRKGLSQEELAERCSLHPTTIAHLESNLSYSISIVALHRISKGLEVSPSQILIFD